jgi:hypothetical protein
MAELTFTARRVINIHAHVKPGTDVHQKVAVWKEQGAIRTCVQSIVYSADEPNANEALAPLLEKYADHLIGFGGLNLSEAPDTPAMVRELHAKGFRGLKCIQPARPYDDDAYMPLYESAAKLGMPILFHTGWLAFRPGYRGPCVNDYMRPVRLERIARYFPELTLIGAHLGTPWNEEAINLAINLPNVHFDISGGSASAQWGSLIKRALAPFPGADFADPDQHIALRLFREKLLFGTDNPPIERWVPRALDILDHLHIPEDARECFFWKTAARILRVNAGE